MEEDLQELSTIAQDSGIDRNQPISPERVYNSPISRSPDIR
jgi:hypothetical protein